MATSSRRIPGPTWGRARRREIEPPSVEPGGTLGPGIRRNVSIFRGVLGFLLATPAHAAPPDVTSSAPDTLSVTIYRNPFRAAGGLNLDQLGGFALVTETRRVSLPAGEARLRFEGVADGIIATTAIVAGLPGGVVEKNRDAHLLTPAGLIKAALGTTITLVRTNRRTGRAETVPARVLAAANGGVVLQTADGIETPGCGGSPQRFVFDRVPAGLTATPTLSVLTRSATPVTAEVTLAYLARGFDWAANYVATVRPDGRSLDLTGWVTLANGGSVGFPRARTQVVAGRLNAEILAFQRSRNGGLRTTCWPMASTKSAPLRRWSREILRYRAMDLAMDTGQPVLTAALRIAAPPPPPPPPPPAPVIAAEGLGDLKLYRIPAPTTVSARGQKQVLLLEQSAVPFERRHRWRVGATETYAAFPATLQLRALNRASAHLGLPLPSGTVAVVDSAAGRPMLAGRGDLGDSAVGETLKLDAAQASDITLALAGPEDARVATLRNASPRAVTAVLQLIDDPTAKIAAPKPASTREDGLATWIVPLAAGETREVRYRIARRR